MAIGTIIRDYEPRDLGAVLRLWQLDVSVSAGTDGLSVDEAVGLMSSGAAIALVAERDGELVGMGLGSVAGLRGWIHRVSVLSDGGADDLEQQLLDQLEPKLAERGAARLAAVVRRGDRLRPEIERRGYRSADGVLYVERAVPPTLTAPAALARVGGRMVEPEFCERLRGQEHAQQIIERRVILPLAAPELAARHAVRPPKAIVLFGPPGTGKTTFAKSIACHLDRPFVELQPATLVGEGPEREAALLAQAFDRILGLGSAVIFVDEVEDLASMRPAERRVGPRVTNEFLKQIPRVREASHHLLVCATNWVGRLDPAFLRPGRFDYVLPIGPPDRRSRAVIWQRYVEEITDEEVDVERLVEASELFTPADIEFAAGQAAQRAFEREYFDHARHRARTEDFLAAIAEVRPTLTEEMVDAFGEDTRRFARY